MEVPKGRQSHPYCNGVSETEEMNAGFFINENLNNMILLELPIFIASLIIGAGAFVVGAALAYIFTHRNIRRSAHNIIKEAEAEAEMIKKDKILQAKEKFLQLKAEHEKVIAEKNSKIAQTENKMKQRESALSIRFEEAQRQKKDIDIARESLTSQVTIVEQKSEELERMHKQQVEQLQAISGMSADEAKAQLIDSLKEEAKTQAMSYVNEIMDEAKMTANREAKRVVIETIQRVATETAIENSVTVFHIENDEMKGRIIGREGRNIRALEAATGVEIIVDDTPNAITVSGFSPIRRHIAKRALDYLIKDGRIHPTKIEDAIEKAKQDLALDIKKAGEEALYEVGVAGLDPKLVQIIGRLKYRTSYGQNALRHSVEVAHLSALLAEELGADVTIAKKAGLLHDIGKAVDHEVQGTHPEIGRDIGKKFNLAQNIIDPIETHHDDHPRGLISVIVKVADAISAARPGARHDTYEQYLQRLEELEKIATTFDGVERAYAIQAGREIRVFVMPDQIDDLGAHNLAKEVAKRIETELKYPGEIKVSIIREMRVTEYAR